MLVLYETPLGYCLFKLTNEAKVGNPDLWKEFETPEGANALLKLRGLHRFSTTVTAVEEITSIQEGKLGKGLKQFLLDEVIGKGKGKETLAVIDSKLGKSISKKLEIKVLSDSTTQDLYRGIRSQLASLLDGLNPDDLSTMSLGLSHSLSRFKLKFSPEKVDTMVVQSIALLDDLDKEINIYAMRVKEWYGWHFPELAKILTDNLAYARIVKAMGFRTNAANTDMSKILPEELESTVKVAAEISMGTEIADIDIINIHSLCDQVIEMTTYRTQLADYLRNRMTAIAPNLTVLVGELVGARLISHAGSLMNLAKHPASTVQILGAEKALFRALKTKHDTPKYGLIYHASLIGQAPPKLKGKMARMVATKAALSIRVDALTDIDGKSGPVAPAIGLENRAKLESRLRALEYADDLNGQRPTVKKQQRYEASGQAKVYNTAADAIDMLPTDRDPTAAAMTAVLEVKAEKAKEKEERKKKKKEHKEKNKDQDEIMAEPESPTRNGAESKEEKKARKKREKEAAAAAATPGVNGESEKKASKKRSLADIDSTPAEEGESRKKKKKKKESSD